MKRANQPMIHLSADDCDLIAAALRQAARDATPSDSYHLRRRADSWARVRDAYGEAGMTVAVNRATVASARDALARARFSPAVDAQRHALLDFLSE